MAFVRKHAGWDDAFAIMRGGRQFAGFEGTEGNDTYTGTDGDDTINGYGGNDTLDGAGGNDTITGGDGDDRITGGSGDDILSGEAGNDTIVSTGGADRVDGGDWSDEWIGSFADSTESIVFNEQKRSLSNGTKLISIETVTLTAGSGDDRFLMNGVANFGLSGGSGFDTFDFDPRRGGVDAAVDARVDYTADITMVEVDLHNGFFPSHAANVEQVVFSGSSNNDRFEVIGLPGEVRQSLVIDAGMGSDSLTVDFTVISSARFVVGDDGSIDSTYGKFANFEKFDIRVGGGDNTVVLGAGDDQVTARGMNNVIRAGSGNDLITATGSHATIDGGEGVDRWSSELKDVTYDQASGTLSDGTTLAGIEQVSLVLSRKGSGSALHVSDATYLKVESENEHDEIAIDLGNLTGGISVVANFNKFGSTLPWNLTFGEADIELEAFRPITHDISITGTRFDDTFVLSDLISEVVISSLDGGDGFDTASVHVSNGQFVVNDDGTVTSTTGLYTNLERYFVTAYGGNLIALGEADDVITIDDLDAGTNDLSGGGGADQITAGKGLDRLSGDGGDDLLRGGAGDDVLSGGAGDDTLNGGDGNDTAGYYTATAGVTVAIISDPQDTGGAGVDTLTSIENLNGSAFDDSLTGNNFANVLRGREGDDVLSGGGSADRIEGGAGADRVTGGTGADRFTFVKLADISMGARDRILDFSHAEGDRIDLSAIDLSKAAGRQGFTFIGTSAFSGADDIFELRVQDQHNGTFLVQGDVNHDGKADFTFAVTTATPLAAADFLF